MFKIPYDVYFKELSNVYTVLKVVIVTYYHRNNKMIVYTINDVEYSLSPLDSNIMLIYGYKGVHIVLLNLRMKIVLP